jgi:hypothetical protein
LSCKTKGEVEGEETRGDKRQGSLWCNRGVIDAVYVMTGLG